MRTFCRGLNAQAAIAAFLLLAPVCNVRLFAQKPFPHDAPNPFRSMDELWDSAPDANPPTPVATHENSTVSAEELRHPLSRRGRKLLEQAERYSDAGDHYKAIAALNFAVKEKSAAPYAHDVLGSEYIKIHKISDALQEFGEATALMPRFAPIHSNYGYVLCLTGQTERGFEEIETALTLDQEFPRAHYLKGVILLEQGSHEHEAWEDLQLAQKEIPSAHLALALFYARHGRSVAAQQQLQEFTQLGLGPTLGQAQMWLARATPAQVPAGAALGLWPGLAH